MSQTAAPAISRPPLPARRPWTAARITGHVLMAFWIVSGIGLALYLGQNLFSTFASQYLPKYVTGAVVTLKLTIYSFLIGAALSVPLALACSAKNSAVRSLGNAYVYFFRGTPLLAQVFLIYYGLGSFRSALDTVGLWWFFRDAWNCVLLTFALNTAAYQAEILRGAVQSMPKGQWEGAFSLGLSRGVTFFKVILPQALIVALRPYGNEIILLLKGSAISSIVTIYDIMGEANRAFSRSFDFQAYIWAAVAYLIAVELIRRAWDLMEQRLTRHLRHGK
ncbi:MULTISPECIES: ABC transporter permease [unclassified Pannonibacter]|uniref:ABC transporter permease n=1 Tax=unclassified Pannonibacter TaxID=2627228 RepID=UPI001649057F|nr:MULTISPECIES: ABC transporter permease [unclassified Pannonibacter]